MKWSASLIAASVVAMLYTDAIAQTQDEHQQHHPGLSEVQTPSAAPAPSIAPSPGPVAPAPAPSAPGQMGQMPMGQMMQNMPEQCRTMMQTMPQTCMPMMMQMMQGRTGVPAQGMQTTPPPQTDATKAYIDAAERMHGPMMEGLRATDPDVAFVRGMIPHHQGAIDMAKVVKEYGKDTQTKKWADDVIRAQQQEIFEMEEWLKKNAR